MTFFVEGTHSQFVARMCTTDVPNWFSSHTLGMIGVFVTGKHSRCSVGLMIGKTLPLARIFSVGRHSSDGTGFTVAFTGLGANSSWSITGGGLYGGVPGASFTG